MDRAATMSALPAAISHRAHYAGLTCRQAVTAEQLLQDLKLLFEISNAKYCARSRTLISISLRWHCVPPSLRPTINPLHIDQPISRHTLTSGALGARQHPAFVLGGLGRARGFPLAARAAGSGPSGFELLLSTVIDRTAHGSPPMVLEVGVSVTPQLWCGFPHYSGSTITSPSLPTFM